MPIKKSIFGNIEGQEVDLYTLTNKSGTKIKITNYGGIVTSIELPDRNGQYADIVLGFDTLDDYLEEHPYFGAIIGRYANRIAQGTFSLDGKIYKLASNNEPNHLHGGIQGFDKVVWKAGTFQNDQELSIILQYLSMDGAEGYPGNLDVMVTYALTNDNELKINYKASTDKPTPINLTHHGYFNLSGSPNQNILDHSLWIDADKYTVVDETLIPTGELKDVSGAMDFRIPKKIGSQITELENGYDHNYILNNHGNLALLASLADSGSGRIMEVYTSQPGIQLYTGNFLDGSLVGKKGVSYQKHSGLCLETQHFTDSPNQPTFSNTILYPGETYEQQTVYRFGIIS